MIYVSIISVVIALISLTIAGYTVVKNNSKDEKKESVSAHTELAMAITDIKNLGEVCGSIQKDVKAMNETINENFRELERKITTNEVNLINFEKRLEKLEKWCEAQ